MFWESLRPFFEWSHNSAVGVWIREASWAFPLLETLHLFGLTVLLGTIFALSSRMAGVAMQDRPVLQIAREMSPWTTVALVVMIVTGALMFSSEALKCFNNPPFRFKMLFLLLAILFHFTFYRRVSRASEDQFNPLLGKIAAGIALILWVGVGVAGRAIAFY